MNLEKWLSEQPDCTLWKILADVSTINADNNKASNFWVLVAKKVNDEINKRLFVDYEGESEL
jgi:hypothetical protein